MQYLLYVIKKQKFCIFYVYLFVFIYHKIQTLLYNVVNEI